MSEWSLLNARLSVFVTPDAVVPPTTWRDLLGEDPESSVFQRATATRIDTGPFADGTLRVLVQPMRIDWVHEPVGDESRGILPPTLGPFPAAADPLLRFGRHWAESGCFPSILRIALGFTLASPTADRASGYRELGQLIDAVPKAADATDFSYQVNRPRLSHAGIEGLGINRLSKWSVAAFRSFAFSLTLGTPNAAATSPLYHLHVELDINTSPEYQGTIPQASVCAVIDDLFTGALEISQHGDHLPA
jgi:hypothetical protein